MKSGERGSARAKAGDSGVASFGCRCRRSRHHRSNRPRTAWLRRGPAQSRCAPLRTRRSCAPPCARGRRWWRRPPGSSAGVPRTSLGRSGSSTHKWPCPNYSAASAQGGAGSVRRRGGTVAVRSASAPVLRGAWPETSQPAPPLLLLRPQPDRARRCSGSLKVQELRAWCVSRFPAGQPVAGARAAAPPALPGPAA